MSKIIVTSAYQELTILVEELAHELGIDLNVIEAVLEDAVNEAKKTPLNRGVFVVLK